MSSQRDSTLSQILSSPPPVPRQPSTNSGCGVYRNSFHSSLSSTALPDSATTNGVLSHSVVHQPDVQGTSKTQSVAVMRQTVVAPQTKNAQSFNPQLVPSVFDGGCGTPNHSNGPGDGSLPFQVAGNFPNHVAKVSTQGEQFRSGGINNSTTAPYDAGPMPCYAPAAKDQNQNAGQSQAPQLQTQNSNGPVNSFDDSSDVAPYGATMLPPNQPSTPRAGARTNGSGSNNIKEAFSHPSTPLALSSPGGSSSVHEEPDMESSMSSPSWPRTPVSPGSNQRSMLFGTPLATSTPGAAFGTGSGSHVNAKEANSLVSTVCRLLGDPTGVQPDEWQSRTKFYESLVQFCESHGHPITSQPTVSRQTVDLYRLYMAVKQRGGFEEVCKKKHWRDMCVLFGIGQSNSASGQIKKQYFKFLLAYECFYDRAGANADALAAQYMESKKKSKAKAAAAAANAVPAPTQPAFLQPVGPQLSGGYHHQQQLQPDSQQQHRYPPAPNFPGYGPPSAPPIPPPRNDMVARDPFDDGGTRLYYPSPQSQQPAAAHYPPQHHYVYPSASGASNSASTPFADQSVYPPMTRPYAGQAENEGTGAPHVQQDSRYDTTHDHTPFAQRAYQGDGAVGPAPVIAPGLTPIAYEYALRPPSEQGQGPAATQRCDVQSRGVTHPLAPAGTSRTSIEWTASTNLTHAGLGSTGVSACGVSQFTAVPNAYVKERATKTQTSKGAAIAAQGTPPLPAPALQKSLGAVFPPNCVEAAQPDLCTKRQKLALKDIGAVDAWRVVMALKSGLLAECAWALNVLTVFLYDDQCAPFFGLSKLPGLLDVLVDHLTCYVERLVGGQEMVADVFPCIAEPACVEFEEPDQRSCSDVAVTIDASKLCSGAEVRERLSLRHTDPKGSWRLPIVPMTTLSHDHEPGLCASGEDVAPSLQEYCVSGHQDGDGEPTLTTRFFRRPLHGGGANDATTCSCCSVVGCESRVDAAACCAMPIATRQHPRTMSRKRKHPLPLHQRIDTPTGSRFYAERCQCLTNVLRGLSFIPGNEREMVKHARLLQLLGRLLRHVDHPSCAGGSSNRHTVTPSDDERDDEQPRGDKLPRERPMSHGDAAPSTADDCNGGGLWADRYFDEPWLAECVQTLHDDAFVMLCNLSTQLNLNLHDERTVWPLLDALLHWATCGHASAADPLRVPGCDVSPLMYALEAMTKLSVQEANVDLLLATPPWSRLEQLVCALADLLSPSEELPLKEFAIVLLSAFAGASELVATVLAQRSLAIHHLVVFLEVADTNMHQVVHTRSMNALRENPELMGTSVGMLRRAANVLHAIARLAPNRSRFDRYQLRLLHFTMSQLMDSRVAATIADALHQLQRERDDEASAADDECPEKATVAGCREG